MRRVGHLHLVEAAAHEGRHALLLHQVLAENLGANRVAVLGLDARGKEANDGDDGVVVKSLQGERKRGEVGIFMWAQAQAEKRGVGKKNKEALTWQMSVSRRELTSRAPEANCGVNL